MTSEERLDDVPVYYDRIPDRRMRLLDEAGTAFVLGLAGSSAFNLLRGGGFRAVSANAPRAAGSLAAFVAVLSAADGAASAARRKEDDGWNGLAAGAAAWAALGARRGAACAATLGLLWGLQIVECRFSDWLMKGPAEPQRTRPLLPAAAPSAADGGFLEIPQAHQSP